MAAGIARVGTTVDELGEGPVWDNREGCLYWLDVIGRKLNRLRQRQAAGEAAEAMPLTKLPGAMALREQGGLLLAFRNGFGMTDKWGEPQRFINQTCINFAKERINDGATDRAGRFWFGTFSPAIEPGAGGLYRMDQDLSIHRMDGNITMSNGIAWSSDNKWMYFTDSRPGCVYRYPFSLETGDLGTREIFLDYRDRPGRPDGCTVDAEGYLWVAEPFGGSVSRYTPDGSLDRIIHVPVSRPTSLTFGGADLRTLFVTTMHFGMSPEMRAAETLAGALFAVDTEIRGMPEPRFNG